jgi:hypothetical protein
MARRWCDRVRPVRALVDAPDDGPRFLLEARDTPRVVRQVGGEKLERDLATQPDLGGEPHLAHAAPSKERNELVGVQPGPRAEDHVECGRL